jgi:hypothetical protein
MQEPVAVSPITVNQLQFPNSLEAALAYHRAGISVIPLTAAEKVPLRGFKWKRFTVARATEDELTQWFGPPQSPNLGVVLGRISGNLFVRDFDQIDSYFAWAERHADLAVMLPTVSTGRSKGGRHVYFHCDPRAIRSHSRGTGTTIALPDGEVRGDGSYVLAPPSIHPSGQQYCWVTPSLVFPWISDPVAVGLVSDTASCTSAQMPQDIGRLFSVKLDLKNKNIGGGSSAPTPTGGATVRPIRFNESLKEIIKRTLPTGPGQRHKMILQFARRLKASEGGRAKLPEEMLGEFCEWFAKAVRLVRTKDWKISYAEFCEAWRHSTCPLGSVVSTAICDDKAIAPLDRLRLAVGRLQMLYGARPFPLSDRTAGQLIGVSKTRARDLLNKLLLSGDLIAVKSPSFAKRKATEYLYTGTIHSDGAISVVGQVPPGVSESKA